MFAVSAHAPPHGGVILLDAIAQVTRLLTTARTNSAPSVRRMRRFDSKRLPSVECRITCVSRRCRPKVACYRFRMRTTPHLFAKLGLISSRVRTAFDLRVLAIFLGFVGSPFERTVRRSRILSNQRLQLTSRLRVLASTSKLPSPPERAANTLPFSEKARGVRSLDRTPSESRL